MHSRIVVKIGSSSLTQASGEIHLEKIRYFAAEIVKLKQAGHEVLLVTSGSIAAGFKHIGYAARPKQLAEKQAAAAVGQALLMEAYSEAFHVHGAKVAQILLTRANFSNRKQAQNAGLTIEELVRHDIIPIINENDTVAVDEIRFGDNDQLSALVANLVKAQMLIICTDTDGLYTADPRKDANARKIAHVDKIDEQIWQIAGEAGSAVGTGGMRSKIEAAKIAVFGGVRVFVGMASNHDDLVHAVAGNGRGTYFTSQQQKLSMKKQWLGFHSLSKGRIIVDEGAEQALLAYGKSLLPAGVVAIEGTFSPGDILEVYSQQRKLLGRGVVNYTTEQLQASIGQSTDTVMKHIGLLRPEVIHRDEWITLLHEQE